MGEETKEDMAWLNHEDRIYKLEIGQENLQAHIKKLNDSVIESQAASSERSKMMMNQNTSLIQQNERLSNQLGEIFETVTSTRDKEATRAQEIKKLTMDSRAKMVTMIIGSGSIGYIIIETLISVLGK